MNNLIKKLKQLEIEFFLKKIPSTKSELYPLPNKLPKKIKNALNKNNIKHFYSHQKFAFEKIKEGENVVVATPTASGKTLTFNLPVLEEIIQNKNSTALYLFPTKALAQDQQKNLQQLIQSIEPNIKSAIYDGDTPPYQRQKIKKTKPQIIITNPDMLHLAILPYYSSWTYLLKNLKFVIIDEIHTYRGVFGSHFSQIIRRLQIILNKLQSNPQFICCSATINNPHEFVKKIIGKEIFVIDKSGAKQHSKNFLFFEDVENTYTLAVKLFEKCLHAKLKTIVFTRSRKIAELIYKWTCQSSPEFESLIASYRAGYIANERREIEEKLFKGELLGVVSTSALELGIDVGTLDACILVGYPGSIMSSWQRAGRVGRERESLIFFIPIEDPLDKYFTENPENFFSRPCEEAIVDTGNYFILKEHLLCAASENPLTKDEIIKFFSEKEISKCIKDALKEKKLSFNENQNLFYCNIPRIQRQVNIRSIGESYQIINSINSKTIGTTEFPRVYRECHAGAIYLHNGEEFLVEKLDLISKTAFAKKVNVDYYTRPHSTEEIKILEKVKEKKYNNLSLGVFKVMVKETVLGYEKRSTRGNIKGETGEKICEVDLDLPPFEFITTSLAIILPNTLQQKISNNQSDFLGGLHGAEHSLIATLPLFVLCDRWDLGGVSYNIYPQINSPVIFIYDGYAGGVGLSFKAFNLAKSLFKETYNLVKNCECKDGCPTCIQSPKCGNGNKPLDKIASIKILQILQNI